MKSSTILTKRPYPQLVDSFHPTYLSTGSLLPFFALSIFQKTFKVFFKIKALTKRKHHSRQAKYSKVI
jgi:hypothetical protein